MTRRRFDEDAGSDFEREPAGGFGDFLRSLLAGVPWSEAAIGGFALERTLSAVQLTRLEARAPKLWPPGPYALGMAAATAVEAIVTASRRALSVLTVLDGEYGVRNRLGSMPALLDPGGVARIHVPSLSTRERVRVETALTGGA